MNGRQPVGLPFFVGFEYSIQAPLKMSPDGQWLTSGGWLFRFDPLTGDITNFDLQIYPQPAIVSFTADSRYLYYRTSQLDGQELVRVDLEADDILASAEIIAADAEFVSAGGQMQLAPNGNLYFTEFNNNGSSTRISEVACPSSV